MAETGDDDSSELNVVESYGLGLDSDTKSVNTNPTLSRHLQCSWTSSSSASSSAATSVVSPLDSGLGTAPNSSRPSTILTPANTTLPSEYISQSPVLPQEYTDAWLESQLAKAEQDLCGLRTELMFYYQRKITRANTVQSMKKVYEDRREGHTRAIAEYMTTGAMGSRGVQEATTTIPLGIEMGGEVVDHDEVGEAEVKLVEVVAEEVEQMGEAKTDKAVERTGNAIEQTESAAEQRDSKQPEEITNPSTILMVEATPTPARALPPSSPYNRWRKSPPPPPPINDSELPPVPPLKSVLRQLMIPAVANCPSNERSFASPTIAAPRVDIEAITVSLSSPPRPDPLPETELPPMPPVQSVRRQIPIVPPRPTFIHGKTRNSASLGVLPLPPGPAAGTHAITTDPPAPPHPIAEAPPAPSAQPIQQQLPIVPPRPVVIRGKMRNPTPTRAMLLPDTDTETLTLKLSPPSLPGLPETGPLPLPPLHDSMVLVQQHLSATVPPIARPATRVEKRTLAAPALLAPGLDTVTAPLASTTVQRRPFLLPSIASSRAGAPAPTVPITADESRRKVPTRSNTFSALLEAFNKHTSSVTQQPDSKL